MKYKKLTDIKENELSVIHEIKGEHASKKLEALGLRPGGKITKISSHFWKGPVTIRSGRMKIAIGHGLADKIIVESHEK
jgi:ferrous iron transport protein A